ncbi:hypothetical protein NADFUDRAFT_49570 [Nadsonia fulvescens var. elongata DSM 6958]|uniref:Uncharacterized protein n=1 Tax=Nadsonia fulvescens var. elongata DSM 6958 TaxID=857566 RepID=A0A1E3PP94_9ASCO|nr:hypothetical protein NADFUDRAFT_49570 [Nadsonia fulvescens var. elongata DSM 6958]
MLHPGVRPQSQPIQKDTRLGSKHQSLYQTRDYHKEVSSKKAIVLQSGSPCKTQFGPNNMVLKDAVYMTGEDALFGPVLAVIYSDPTTKHISTVFISRHGATGYTDITLSPKSKYYDACRNLLNSHTSSPIRKALAITALRSFATMNPNIRRVLSEHALKYSVYNWDETLAGTLASSMKLADKKYPQQVGQAILSTGILEPSVIGTYVIDVIYEDSDTTIEMNNELVYLLGEQLEQLFDPLSEFSPEPTEILYTPPDYPPPNKIASMYNRTHSNPGSELVDSIITELVQVQHNFQLNLVKFLQQYLIPLRVEVISHHIDGLTISKLNSIFPPTIDEVARINNLFYDALQSSSKYGFFEVIKACGMTIPYFYKACMRHEAATKNFSRTLNTYYANIHHYFQPSCDYSIRMIESVVQSSLNLTKIKMIIDRLMKQKPSNLSKEEDELVAEYYHSARETIDSFGRETTLEPYNRRIFTPTGKILIEIASDWPLELQYGWMNRCVVTIFDGYNVLTSNHETAILFTDHIIFLETVEPQQELQSFSDNFNRFTSKGNMVTGLTPAEIHARRRASGRLASGRNASIVHKPSVADMLMHSLINKVPVPYIPKLRVIGWAAIDELSMSEFNNSHSINITVRKGCMKKPNEDEAVDEVRIYELNPNTHVGGASKIIELLTKSRIMSKTQPFHLFNNRPVDSPVDGFNMYMTVHESQGYQEENQKTPIAMFLNTRVNESFLYEKQLAVCYSLSINRQSESTDDVDNDLVHIEAFSVLDYSFSKKVRKGDVNLLMNHEVAKAYTLFFSALNPNMIESIINGYGIISNWLVKFATERDEAHRRKAEKFEKEKQESALRSVKQQSLIKSKQEQIQPQKQLQTQLRMPVHQLSSTQRSGLVAGPRVTKKRSSVASFFRMSSRKSGPSGTPQSDQPVIIGTTNGIAAEIANKRGPVKEVKGKSNYRNISPAAIFQRLRGKTAYSNSTNSLLSQSNNNSVNKGKARVTISEPMYPTHNTNSIVSYYRDSHADDIIVEEEEDEKEEIIKLAEEPIVIPPTPLLEVSERYNSTNEAITTKPTILFPTSRSRHLMDSPILEDPELEEAQYLPDPVRPRKDFGSMQQYHYKNTNSDYDDTSNSEIINPNNIDKIDSSIGSGSVLNRLINEELDNYQSSVLSNHGHSEADFVFDDSQREQKRDDSGWATITNSNSDSVNNTFDKSIADLADNMSDFSLSLMPPSRPTTSDGRFLQDSPFVSGEEGFQTLDEDHLSDRDESNDNSFPFNESGNGSSVIIRSVTNESKRSRNIRNRNSINSQFLSQNFNLNHSHDDIDQEGSTNRQTTNFINLDENGKKDDEERDDDDEDSEYDADNNDEGSFNDDDGLSLSSRSFVSATEDEGDEEDDSNFLLRKYSDINIFQFMNQTNPVETADPASIVAPGSTLPTMPTIPSTPSRRSVVYSTSSANRMMMYKDRDSPQRYRAATPKSISPQKPATPSSASIYYRRNSSIYSGTPGASRRTSMMMDASFAYLAGLLNGTVDISTLINSPASIINSSPNKAYRYDQHGPTMSALEENSSIMASSSSAVLYPALRDSSIVFLGQYIRKNAFEDVVIKRENSDNFEGSEPNNNDNNSRTQEDIEGFNIAQANKRLSIGSFSERGLTRTNSSCRSFRHSLYGAPNQSYNYYHNHVQGSSPNKRLSLYASSGSSSNSSPTKRGSTPIPVSRAYLQHHQHRRQQSAMSTNSAYNKHMSVMSVSSSFSNSGRFPLATNEGQWMAQNNLGGRQRNSMISWVTKDKNNRDSIISWTGGDEISFTPLNNDAQDHDKTTNAEDDLHESAKVATAMLSPNDSLDPETWDENELSRGTDGDGEIYMASGNGTQESFNMSNLDVGTPHSIIHTLSDSQDHGDGDNPEQLSEMDNTGDITNPDYTNTEEHFNEFANNDNIVDRTDLEERNYNQPGIAINNEPEANISVNQAVNETMNQNTDVSRDEGHSFTRDLSKVSGMSLNTLQVSTLLSQIDTAIELECSDIMDGRVSDRNANEMVRIRSVVLMLLDRARGGFSSDVEEEATARCIMLSEAWIIIAMMNNSGRRSDRYKTMLNSVLDIETLRRYFVSEGV